jgi:hypothetical protein
MEFIEGMKILFTEGFEKTSKFIFDFYDFDKDGHICKDDIRTVLSYVSLKSSIIEKKEKGKFESESYKDRVESQMEIHSILEKCFKEFEDSINYTFFVYILENICSDIYFFILIFLLEKKPFSKITLSEYETQVNLKHFYHSSKTPTISSGNGKLLTSPNMESKFSPCITMSKSPFMKRRSNPLNRLEPSKMDSKEFLLKLSGMGDTPKSNARLSKEDGLSPILEKSPFQLIQKGKKGSTSSIGECKRSSFGSVNNKILNQIPTISRKPRYDLKNLENRGIKLNGRNKSIYNSNDLPLAPAIKQVNDNRDQIAKTIISKINNIKLHKQNSTQMEEDGIEQLEFETEFSQEKTVKCEGYLYKLTDSKKLKKLWFKLIHRDLYYFKEEGDKEHKGMHNLSGVFIKQNQPLKLETGIFHSFSVIYPNKTRDYYVDNENDFITWVEAVKKSTGYSDLNDIYDVKEKLGNGKFGLVRLGVHKKTGRKVAIKVMNKKDMNNQDLELVRTEIEILKISQHPNIIRLYDVFENVDYIYIIMEYCSGGDLFSYLEKRGFRLSENRAAQLVHKLCTAVYYLHSYGIAHRDLKPENILMTDNSETADIRLLDFGLSKIIGPNETCREPYGTLSYVAPEVLLEKPYTKAVDLWSIGITTYLLLCGRLPFDDEHSEKEIARQTIHDQVPYTSSAWKYISSDAKALVDNLLQKNSNHRMNIKEVLEHAWFTKFNKSALPEIRRKSKEDRFFTFKIYSSTDEYELLPIRS